MTDQDKQYFELLRAQLELVRQQVQLLESRIRCVESDFATYRRSSPADRIADLITEAASRLSTTLNDDASKPRVPMTAARARYLGEAYNAFAERLKKSGVPSEVQRAERESRKWLEYAATLPPEQGDPA